MAHFVPFKGILPNKNLVERVVSRPFDNYSKIELHDLLADNPVNFLNVILPAIPNDEDKIPYKEKLKLGKHKFDEFIHQQIFVQDEKPCYYVYRQTQDENQFTGIIGAISIDDCIDLTVKPHEQTLEHKEEKLKEYLKIIDINAEPVVISYKADYEILDITDEIVSKKPYFQFDFPNFGTHEIWKVEDEQTIELITKEFNSLNELYIADGHHRTASSVLLGEEMRKLHPNFNGSEAFNHFMVLMFPHHQIRLREFNRLVKETSLSNEELLQKLAVDFHIEHTHTFPNTKDEIFSFGMYLNHEWYHLVAKEGVVERLPEDHQIPPQVLTDLVLSPILDIHDLRKDKRIAFIGGKTNATLLEEKVNSGEFQIAFTVNKISIPTFKKFADSGWFMPPKSTYFEPKLLSGLVVYELGVAEN